ncbi:MAG: thermonuclease family protein [Solirubrobacteraceae bacterium]
MLEPNHTYAATFLRAHDGDTYTLRVDLGLRVAVTIEVRLRGVNTPEITGETKPAGLVAQIAAEEFLRSGSIVIVTYKDRRSFTRWIADVFVDGSSVADHLLDAGVAVPFL